MPSEMILAENSLENKDLNYKSRVTTEQDSSNDS